MIKYNNFKERDFRYIDISMRNVLNTIPKEITTVVPLSCFISTSIKSAIRTKCMAIKVTSAIDDSTGSCWYTPVARQLIVHCPGLGEVSLYLW
jgi:hypothetical protein